MGYQMVTWRHRSRDLKRSNSWPQYTLRAQYLENGCKFRDFEKTTNRKWYMDYRMVTWPMTLRDVERSNSWPQYA